MQLSGLLCYFWFREAGFRFTISLSIILFQTKTGLKISLLFHFFLNNITQGSFLVLLLFLGVKKKIASTELIMFGSMKRNTIEFNSSNNWSPQTFESKELSLPSSLSLFVERNSMCYTRYQIFKKGRNICTFMVFGTQESQ